MMPNGVRWLADDGVRAAVLVHGAALAVTALSIGLGMAAPGLSRIGFIAGMTALAFLAVRLDGRRYVELVIILFAFTPMVRRIIDLHVGWDESGLVLVAPYAASLMSVLPLHRTVFEDRGFQSGLTPYLLMLAAIAYGLALSGVQGEVFAGLLSALRWTAPILFGLYVLDLVRRDPGIVQAVTRCFQAVLPLMAGYGILQFLDPLPWDRMWMLYVAMDSIGVPEPYQVRVFGTMNSPASLACMVMVGMLFVGCRGRGWGLLVVFPASLVFALTLYRSAWVGCSLALMVCLWCRPTRWRAMLAVGIGVAVVGLAAVTPPFDQIVGQRLASLTALSSDGSGAARVDQLAIFYEMADELVFGNGIGQTYKLTRSPPIVVDGALLVILITLGSVVGMIYLTGMLWASLRPAASVAVSADAGRVGAFAATVGLLAQLPLGSVQQGETAVLLFMCVALSQRAARARPVAPAHAPDGLGARA